MLEKKNCNSSIFYSIWFYCKLGFNYNKKSLYFHVSLLQKKMNHEETVEKEVEELNYFQKFMKYISLSVNHHLNKCKNIFCCSVRAFISNLWHLKICWSSWIYYLPLKEMESISKKKWKKLVNSFVENLSDKQVLLDETYLAKIVF